MTLSELIAKLEVAEEGSRELDAEIWALDAAIQAPLEFGHEDYGSARREWVKCGSLGAWMDEIPHHTTSLDAALPWENIYRVEFLFERELWTANHDDGEWPHPKIGCARTEPLARRVAALKAKEAEN